MTFTAADVPFESVTRTPKDWRLLDDVQVMDVPDPQYLIDQVIPQHATGVLYGPTGACKTTLATSLMVSIATGADWFGHRVSKRGNSVYVAAEDLPGFKVRLSAKKRAASYSLDTSIGVYTFPETLDLRDAIAVNAFTRFLKAAGAFELLVVDTYASATVGAAENSSEDTTRTMAHAAQWRDELNLTVLFIHHTNAAGSRERGHSSMRGAADTMISVTPIDDVIAVECSKQRNAAPFSKLTLKLTPVEGGGCVLRLASDVLASADLSPAQQKVIGILRDTFGEDGATKSDWQKACADISERTFHRAAKMLVEKGLVETAGKYFRITASEGVSS